MSKYFFIDLDNESSVRFEKAKFFSYTDNHDPLTSYLLSELKTLPVAGFFTVAGGEEGRPDSLSFNIYADTQYWWILMAYNDLSNIQEITNGMTIKYPSLSSLEDLYFSLKTQEQATNNET